VARGCCPPSGYEDLFGEAQARRDARRYRRHGVDRTARWIVEAVTRHGVQGATVLEPGGGVGAIQLELLKAGATRSVVVELSAGYEQSAAELAREAGVADRMHRQLADFATGDVDDADVVILHRVVCCYPDYERLLGVAAQHARRLLVFTHPPRNTATRAAAGFCNGWMRLRGKQFRAFAHPPEAMVELVRQHGFEPFAQHRALFWRGVAFERTPAGPWSQRRWPSAV
jgi:D-arabinose 1-dehydrogenase-like Zn-dependent alcohol dehydrogenase